MTGSRARSRRQRRRSQATTLAIALVCAASAAGALLADGAPTTLTGLDGLLRMGFAVGVTLAVVPARPASWAIAAGLLVIPAVNDPVLLTAALVVFAATVLVTVRDRPGQRPHPVVAAAIGAALAQVMLRLPGWGPNGATALVVTLGVAVVVGSCLRAVAPPTRRRIVLGLAVGGGLVLVLVVAFAANLLLTRSDLQAGIDDAQAGVDAARRGDTELAIRSFERAGAELQAVAHDLDQPWSRAARVVPVVGQHETALRTLVSDAAALASTGALAAREANVDALRVRDGRLDPAQVAALGDPLARVSATLASTAADLRELESPWFVGPMQHGVDRLTGSVRRATHDAATARLTVRLAPQLLGTGRPTNWFVMFTQPAEARGAGGMLGNFAILTVTDGRFEMTRFGRHTDLIEGGDPATKQLTGLDEYLARYGRFSPTTEWRNINMTPDFPTVAEVVRQLYPQSGGTGIDGVISLDPHGLAALLKLTGPVAVEGRATPLTAKNAAQFLLEDQYLTFGENTERIDFLDETAHAVTDRLLHSTLPGPRAVGQVLGRAARGGHLQVMFFEQPEQPDANAGAGRDGAALFTRLGVAGAHRAGPGDTLGLVTQNASGNKIELFLHRALAYDATVDPATGRTQARATVTLRNDAPASGLPDYVIGNGVPGMPVGTNRTYLSLYSTLDLEGATVDGAPVEMRREQEHGLRVYSTTLIIPPGGQVTLRMQVQGGNRFVQVDGDPSYRLDVWHQPTVNPDDVHVTVRTTPGWSLDDARSPFSSADGTATYRGSPDRDLRLTARIDG